MDLPGHAATEPYVVSASLLKYVGIITLLTIRAVVPRAPSTMCKGWQMDLLVLFVNLKSLARLTIHYFYFDSKYQ